MSVCLLAFLISYIFSKCIDRLLEYVRKLHVRMQGASLAIDFRKIVVIYNIVRIVSGKIKTIQVTQRQFVRQICLLLFELLSLVLARNGSELIRKLN